MLNKKILVGGAGEEAPHVKLKVGSLTILYGWSSVANVPYGSISRVPVWEGIRLTDISSFIVAPTYTTCAFSGKIPKGGISIRRLDTGYEIKTKGGVESSKVPGSLFTQADTDKTVPLVFDPPSYRISIRKSSRYLHALERRAW